MDAEWIMEPTNRQLIQRASAVYLLTVAVAGLGMDGVVGVGLGAAYGVVCIVAVLLWRAEPSRAWHRTAMAVHVLLAVASLVFWPIFAAANLRWFGYLTIMLHLVFTELQLCAAAAAECPRYPST